MRVWWLCCLLVSLCFVHALHSTKNLRVRDLVGELEHEIDELGVQTSMPPVRHRLEEDEDDDENPQVVDKTLMITGLVRNAARTLPSLLKDLRNTACAFRDASFVVLESNSANNTNAVLEEFAVQEQQACTSRGRDSALPFSFRKVLNGRPEHNERIHRLVNARNELRDYLQDHDQVGHRDFTFMVDMDIVSLDSQRVVDFVKQHLVGHSKPAVHKEEALSYSEWFGFEEEDQVLKTWTGVCFNDHFRDTFATVAEDGSWAFFRGVRAHADEVGLFDAREFAQKSGSEVIPVRSCFNAATLYKTDTFLSKKCKYETTENAISENPRWELYTSRVDSHQMCEHVYFHDCLQHKAQGHMALTTYESFVLHTDQRGLEEEGEASGASAIYGSQATLRKWLD